MASHIPSQSNSQKTSVKLRYFLYGTIAVGSSISLLAQASTSDGVFGDYFRNIITSGCIEANSVITGFDSGSTSSFGKPICITLKSLIGTIFSGATAPDGQAITGFNPDGTPIYKDASQWKNVTTGIAYTGGNVGIGIDTPTQKLDVNGNINLANRSDFISFGGDDIIRYSTNYPGATNYFSDYLIGRGGPLATGRVGSWGDIFIGDYIGRGPLYTGGVNVLIGGNNMSGNGGSARANIGVGLSSLRNLVNGEQNVAIGQNALYWGADINNTIAVGYNAGSYWSLDPGSSNSYIGAYSHPSVGGLSNATAIGANTVISQSDTVILGNNAKVGIGTSTPTAKLEVAGQIKITDGSQGTGKVLVSDADGLASWQTIELGSGYSPGSVLKTTPGNFSFTVPKGVTTLEVEVWGAGGGGSAGAASMNYHGYWTYTTGGSGGSGWKTLGTINVTPGQVISGDVGYGGWGNDMIETLATYGWGGNGGPSWFGGISANGGSGGRGHDWYCNGGSCNGDVECHVVYNAPGGNIGATCFNASANTDGPAGGAAVASAYPVISGGGAGGAGGSTLDMNAAAGITGSNGQIYIKW